MPKIPVLYMIDMFLGMAGAERNLFQLATHLDRQRFEPIVVCLRGGVLVDRLRARGVEVIDLQLERIYSPAALAAGARLVRLMRRRRVQVVVTYHEGSDFFGSVLARAARVPVVISSRRDTGYKLTPRHVAIYRRIHRLFDAVVTVSDAVKQAIVEREGVPLHKLHVVRNGVELERFSGGTDREALLRSVGLDPERPVVGSLAVVRPVKGHRHLLAAAAQLRQRFPEAQYLFVGYRDITGEHYSGYFDELRQILAGSGLERDVVFTGERSDVPEVLAAMDIKVLASASEGFPNSVVEAMAAGRPVVATAVGGTPEAVQDGETGILVPPEDPQALAAALGRLLADPGLARRMGQAGRQRVEQVFSLERMVGTLEQLYEQLLAG